VVWPFASAFDSVRLRPLAPIRLLATDRRVSERFGFFPARSHFKNVSFGVVLSCDHDAAYRQLLPNTINNEHPCLVRSRATGIGTSPMYRRGLERFTTPEPLRRTAWLGGGRFLPRVDLVPPPSAVVPLVGLSHDPLRMTMRSASPPGSCRVEIVSASPS